MKTNLPYGKLVECLNVVSKRYNGNITFNRLEEKGKFTFFTLAAKSGEAGSRNAASGRKMPKASWEVHGQLFEEIIKQGDEFYIYSSFTGRIDKNGGNWQEIKAGRAFGGNVYMSELSN